MCLKKSISCEKLHKYTTDAPDVTWVSPTKIEDDFGCTVMPSRDYRRMILIIEGGRAEIDQPDLGIEQDPPLPGDASGGGGRGRYRSVVGESLIAVAYEEDVFRFEVGMD